MVIISKRHFRFHLIHCKADFPVVSCPPFYHLINFSVLSVRGNMTFLTSQNEINQMKGGESRVLIMYNLVSSCFWKSNLLLNIKSLLLVKFWLWKHVMNSFHYVTCGLRKLIERQTILFNPESDIFAVCGLSSSESEWRHGVVKSPVLWYQILETCGQLVALRRSSRHTSRQRR